MPNTKKLVIASSLACLLLLGAFAPQRDASAQKKPAPAAKCAAMSDEEIVKTIADRIRNDQRFADQLEHISVTSKDRKVTLAGWVKPKPMIRVVEGFAKATGCAVDNKLGASAFRVGCGLGMKDCHGSCIPVDQSCESVGRKG